MKLYMSFTSIIVALFVSFFSVFYSYEKQVHSIKPIEQTQCKAIVFDLGGVVVDTCSKKTAWEIGPTTLFNYWRNGTSENNFSKLKNRLYSMLHAAHSDNTQGNLWEIKDGEGNLIPQLMAEWLRGMRPNQEILKQVQKFANANPTWFIHSSEKRALLTIARLTFDPHRFVKTRKIFDESAQLIRECKQRGFKLYVLSNWDRESGKLLVKKHADLFNLFDGIVFSGDVQKTKPEKEIFSCISNIIPAHECVFLDDQPENVEVARALGFNTILVNHNNGHPNIKQVREQLAAIHPPFTIGEDTVYA